MSEIVCQVGNRADQVEFIWSSRGGYFRPYVVSGTQLIELRQAVDRSTTGPSISEKPSCREALERLVFNLNQAGEGPPPWEPSFELAEAGFRLHNNLFPQADETARKVRRWLEDLRKQPGLISLEVVVEELAADPRVFLRCRGTWFTTNGPPRPRSRRCRVPSAGGHFGRSATT